MTSTRKKTEEWVTYGRNKLNPWKASMFSRFIYNSYEDAKSRQLGYTTLGVKIMKVKAVQSKVITALYKEEII